MLQELDHKYLESCGNLLVEMDGDQLDRSYKNEGR